MITSRKASRAWVGRGPSTGTRFVLLLICSLALMVLDHRENHLRTIRRTLSVAVYPIQILVDLPFSTWHWAAESLSGRAELLEQNRSLQRNQLELEVRLQRLAAVEAENARLRAMMGSSAKVADRVQVAEILSVDLDPYRHRITLNKGVTAGAYQGQALLDANGVVGQITLANTRSSEAILISDADHAMPVAVNRNGLRTIAVGSGDIQVIKLPFLPNNADIEVGDLLVSSGLGGAFPAGYPVATVTQVVPQPGQSFASVLAKPAAALDRHREVLLVWFGGTQPPADAEQASEADSNLAEATP